MGNGVIGSAHSKHSTFAAARQATTVTTMETGEKSARHADDAEMRSGSIGIGMDEGGPFVLGGARSAELLQLFIENL